MTTRASPQTRDDVRHWLPSQGVDPAPLAELNAECLELLALRAAADPPVVEVPPLLRALREPWAGLQTHAVKRLAVAPFSLFDAGFGAAPRWLELHTRGVHDQSRPPFEAYFDAAAARSLTHRMLVYGWHLARSRPRAACLVFGISLASVDALAACSLATLEVAAERNAPLLRPRWPNQIAFWRDLLAAASARADSRLHELLLGGIQRLAAETLAAHPP
jgi:hypothetical protein